MRTINDFAGGGNEPSKKSVPATTPSATAATSEQVGMLLHIAAVAGGMVNTDAEGDKIVDEARDSALVTYMSTMDKLDEMVKDKTRWSVDVYNAIVEELRGLYESQRKYYDAAIPALKAERAKTQEQISPHNTRQVSFYALQDGRYLCVDSDRDPGDKTAIKAVGRTPALAAAEFDAIYDGAIEYVPFAVGEPKETGKPSE